jgi:hypothetical protein
LVDTVSPLLYDGALVLVANQNHVGADAIISGPRLAWAYQNIIVPLNQTVHDGAIGGGWTFVGGINTTTPFADGFDNHGLCAPDRWSRQYDESKVIQGNKDGAFHPNYRDPGNNQMDSGITAYAPGSGPQDSGHTAYAALLFDRLVRDLLSQSP